MCSEYREKVCVGTYVRLISQADEQSSGCMRMSAFMSYSAAQYPSLPTLPECILAAAAKGFSAILRRVVFLVKLHSENICKMCVVLAGE